MGNRITRAAAHLPEEAVRERMQAERRLWCRRRWEIIYQALRAPRKAEDIARTVGVSVTTVRRVIATYKQAGVAAIETAGKGGRRHQYLTLEQERAFLQPFMARAARGERVTAAEIQRAFEEETKQPVVLSSIYRLLDRHGWRQRGAAAASAHPPKSKPTSSNTVSVPERREPSPPKGKLQGYPSDLTEQEWTILEPLIPKALPGGRSRTTDMRALINAILYLDRTGGQWRALPHEYPPWSTVWSYFRRWRNDGTWERMHTALREAVRVKQGREPTPSAAIIDSQSVKTSQKGGFAASTEGKRSRAGNVICSSTPMG
jgi:transposase